MSKLLRRSASSKHAKTPEPAPQPKLERRGSLDARLKEQAAAKVEAMERKKAEEAMRKAEEEIRLAAEERQRLKDEQDRELMDLGSLDLAGARRKSEVMHAESLRLEDEIADMQALDLEQAKRASYAEQEKRDASKQSDAAPLAEEKKGGAPPAAAAPAAAAAGPGLLTSIGKGISGALGSMTQMVAPKPAAALQGSDYFGPRADLTIQVVEDHDDNVTPWQVQVRILPAESTPKATPATAPAHSTVASPTRAVAVDAVAVCAPKPVEAKAKPLSAPNWVATCFGMRSCFGR